MITNSRVIFKSGLAVSRQIARRKVLPGDIVIDATCGRGHDTLLLAELVGEEGRVYAFDIQKDAISSSRKLIEEKSLSQRVVFIQADHSQIDAYVTDQPSLCMFNLGYLPGGEHSITTRPETTIIALQKIIDLLGKGGCISLVAYSGHPGGEEEVAEVRSYLAGLSQDNLEVVELNFINQVNNPAHLFVASKLNGGTR